MGNLPPGLSSENQDAALLGGLVHSVATGLATGLTTTLTKVQFEHLYKVSKELLDQTPNAADYVFPSDERTDPVGVWDHLNPAINNYRFMVYIVWLWKRSDSFEQYCKLKKDRKEALEACIQRLLEHIRNVEFHTGQA